MLRIAALGVMVALVASPHDGGCGGPPDEPRGPGAACTRPHDCVSNTCISGVCVDLDSGAPADAADDANVRD